MRHRFLTVLILLAVLCAAATANAAKAKPKPKPKPKAAASKPAAPSVQLAGDKGVFGTVYSIKKDLPLYFRIKSAEYSTDQIAMGDTLYVPTAEEKMLVLHFTVQNPMKTEQFVRWDSLRLTAVDSGNNNHEGNSDWGDDDAVDHAKMALNMKPAQTVNLIAVVMVPAKGSIPKMMILPGEDNGPVLRYMLFPDSQAPAQNKPGALPAPIADPADPTGYTALETVPGVVGTAYPYANQDVTIEKFDYAPGSVGEYNPEEGERYLLVTILMKNESPTDQYVRYDTFTPVLTSTDGEELAYKDMFFATGNRPFAQNMKAHSEVRVRMMFAIPKDVTPQKLALKEGESRVYEFEVK